jgi:hypothetical protein
MMQNNFLKRVNNRGKIKMTETIRRKICDVCKREVKEFSGFLNLSYLDNEPPIYCGFIPYRGYPVEIIRKDICVDCCRKLHKAIDKVLTEASE